MHLFEKQKFDTISGAITFAYLSLYSCYFQFFFNN